MDSGYKLLAHVSEHFACFGYGSLINLNTLHSKHLKAAASRLNGWRRHWQARETSELHALKLGTDIPIALLTIHPATDTQIDGVVFVDHTINLAKLDRREQNYQRTPVPLNSLMLDQGIHQKVGDIFTYVAPDKRDENIRCGILSSYLDVVLAGVETMFGEDGLERFVASTSWDNTIRLDDRADPLYPRHQSLPPTQQEKFDRITPI